MKYIKCVDIDIRRDIGCARSGNKPLLGNSKPLAGWIVVVIKCYTTQSVFLSASPHRYNLVP